MTTPPGWYPDPTGRFPQRYWDGQRWTDNVSPPGGPVGHDSLPRLSVGSTTAQASTSPCAASYGAGAVRDRTAVIVVLSGAGGLLLGSFLPWASVTTAFGRIDVEGTRGDGVITLVLAIAIGVMGVFLVRGSTHRALLIVSLVAASLALLVCLIDIGNVSSVASEQTSDEVDASVGYGLYLAAAGAAAAVIGSIIALRQRWTP